MQNEVPKYNPELILSDELDGSIISLFLRDNGTLMRGTTVDQEMSFNLGDDGEYALRGLNTLRNTVHQEADEAISLLECEIDKILIHAWNGIEPLSDEML